MMKRMPLLFAAFVIGMGLMSSAYASSEMSVFRKVGEIEDWTTLDPRSRECELTHSKGPFTRSISSQPVRRSKNAGRTGATVAR